MNRRPITRTLIAVGSAMVVAILFISAIIYCEPRKWVTEDTAEGKTHSESLNVLASERVAYYTEVLAITTGVLAGFGIFQIVFLIRADNNAARSAQIAEKSMIVGQQAFVFASGIKPLWTLDAKSKKYTWVIRPTWENSGNTPTKELRITVGSEMRTTELPLGFNFDAALPADGTGLLGPKSTSLGGSAPNGTQPQLTPADIRDMINGTKKFYMWGRALYYDVFPNTEKHETRFCWLITVARNPDTFKTDNQTLSFGYLSHNEGNSSR